jgi:uncharacterized lipoprotein YajG
MFQTPVKPSLSAVLPLAVGSFMLTACGGGGSSVAVTTPTTELSVEQVNQIALTSDPNSAAIVTAADAAAPSETLAEPTTIATSTATQPAATANDAAAPSDNI